MKGLLKNLGLILILVGVVILLACSFTGNVNNKMLPFHIIYQTGHAGLVFKSCITQLLLRHAVFFPQENEYRPLFGTDFQSVLTEVTVQFPVDCRRNFAI